MNYQCHPYALGYVYAVDYNTNVDRRSKAVQVEFKQQAPDHGTIVEDDWTH